MCDIGGFSCGESGDEQGGVAFDKGSPQCRDLARRILYVAKKKAERKWSGSSRPPIWNTVTIRRNAYATANEPALSCNMGCETGTEGSLEEQGDRSHADGLVSLMERLGVGRIEAEVRLCQTQRYPLKYEAVGLTWHVFAFIM